MSVATLTPQPRLAVVASEAREVKRAQKREKNHLLKATRALAVALAILFATLGLGAGTAQAWPWSKMEEDITAFVTNFCGPEDVPVPSGHGGMDNLFGLNQGDSDIRGTVRPDTSGLGKEPLNGLERIQAGYGSQADTIKPTYERYGFSTLQWDSYGAGCFSTGYWFTGVSNLMLNYFVMVPMMVAMALLQLALDNLLYTVFTGVISPFVSVFTAIFQGWALWLAPIGIVWAFLRSGGNLRTVGKTGAWMFLIFGVFLWMSNNTSTIVTKANNFVTEFAGSAADQISEINGVTTGSSGTALDSINQSLWYGVPYQTWLEGYVGPTTASGDRTRESNGEVSWGSVILNSKYVGNDDAGREVLDSVNTWNGLSYSPNESLADEAWGDMQTKPGAWTKNKIWEKVPYLFNVKAICGDTSNGVVFSSSSAEEDNKWMYGGSCDSAGAGTSAMMPYFTGTAYDARMTVAFTGGFAAFAVCIAIAAASIYLAVQKMLFYFLLLFGPVFLTVAMFGDEKRAAFAKRYGELMIANILKQGVAVLVVLFIANSMSMLLYPPADESFAALRAIPWMMKPTLALFFLIALALFLVPLKRIVTGAVKGDTKVVDKTARMPIDAAKTTAKVAGVATVGVAAVATIAATGGAAAPALAKFGGMATSAGRMMGSRGGVGKALMTVGRGANFTSRVGSSMADAKGKKEALSRLTDSVFANDPGMQEDLKQIPGALDENGNMTPKGKAIAAGALKRMSKQGEESTRADALQRSYMDKFHKGYLAETGKHAPTDPNSPENLRAAAIAKEQDRLSVREAAKHGSSRTQNMGAGAEGADTGTDSNATNTANGGKGTVTEASRAQSAEAVRENLSGPGFGENSNVKANVTVEGAQIAEQMGMSSREVAQNPSALLSGAAYEGGDVSKMDPRHPATGAMNDLRFALMADDTQGIESASMRASEAIAQHGVPSQISTISAVNATPEGMATAINAMPSISEDTPWQVRAEGATTMQAAVAMVPESSAAYEPMQNYVQALGSPTVDAKTVENLREVVIETAAPEVASEAPRVDLTDAIRESADQVSAAPVEVVAAQGVLFGEPSAEAPAPAPAYSGAGVSFIEGEAPAPAPHSEAPPATYSEPPASYSGYQEAAPAPQEAAPAPQQDAGPAPVASGGGNVTAEMDTERIRRELADASDEAAERYRQRIADIGSGADASAPVLPTSTGDNPDGGPAPSLFGGSGSGGGIDLGKSPDEVEEISGMPTDDEGDPQPFRRSRRRRVSGFYDTDDEEDDQKDGE